jgi:hypothetical protein
MKRLYGISSIVVFFFLIAGCTTLTADGENVRVINDADKVQNCELKGKIHSVGLGNALFRARNAAGREWNADTLLISGAGDNLEAHAYICNE